MAHHASPVPLAADQADAARRRVVIVDGALVVRKLLENLLVEAGFTVVAALRSADEVEPVLAHADVDLLIMAADERDDAVVMLAHRIVRRSSRTRVALFAPASAVASLSAGQGNARAAIDVIAKPAAGHFSPLYVRQLIGRLTRTAPDLPAPAPVAGPARAGTSPPLRPIGTRLAAVAIGGSTGGVGGISAILGALPAQNRVPVFVTQHLPANFQPLFVQQLARISANRVELARDGMVAEPGVVFLAHGEGHLVLERGADELVRMRLSREESVHKGLPALDPMFASVGRVYGPGACGIILSGMGRDGFAGAGAIVETGGWVIVQDEASSAVWGMPGVVAKSGLASAMLPPDAMVPLLLKQGLCG